MNARELIERAIARGEITPPPAVPAPVAKTRTNSPESNQRRRRTQWDTWTPERRAEHSRWLRKLYASRRAKKLNNP